MTTQKLGKRLIAAEHKHEEALKDYFVTKGINACLTKTIQEETRQKLGIPGSAVIDLVVYVSSHGNNDVPNLLNAVRTFYSNASNRRVVSQCRDCVEVQHDRMRYEICVVPLVRTNGVAPYQVIGNVVLPEEAKH